MNPITISGTTYSSVAQAWREVSPEGLQLVTVRWRLRDGWANFDAFTFPVVPAKARRGFAEVRASAAL